MPKNKETADERPQTEDSEPRMEDGSQRSAVGFGSQRSSLTVKGSKPPHGGRWVYDKEADELTCVEEPTKHE